MGKISELELAIKDLRTAASTINDVADTLAELFGGKKADTSAPAVVAEAKKEITFDEVSTTLTAIARISKAHSENLRDAIRKFGVTKLSELDAKHYEALLAEAEVIRNAG